MAKHPIRRSWLYRKLISARVFTYLMLLIVLGMLLGTMFPQGRSAARYIKAWGAERFIKYASFNLLDIFHGWWFLILAFVFFTVVLICALERFFIWNTLSDKKIPVFKQRIAAMDIKRDKLLPMQSSRLIAQLAEFCNANGFKLRTGLKNNTLIAQKGYDYTLVSVIYHLGIILCLFGFVVSYLFNFEDDFLIAPEETKTISFANQDTRWQDLKKRFGYEVREVIPDSTNSLDIKLESFLSEYTYQEDRYWPKDWFSDLTIYEGLAIKSQKRIEVNDPLRYRGIVFYQTYYDKKATLELLADDGSVEKEIVVGVYGKFEIPGVEGKFGIRDIRNGLVYTHNRPEEKIGPEFDLTYYPPKKEEKTAAALPVNFDRTSDTTLTAPTAATELVTPQEVTALAEHEKSETPAPKTTTPPPPQKLGVVKMNQAAIVKDKTIFFKSYEEKSGISYRFDPGIYILWPAGILVVLLMMIRVYLPYYRILFIVDQINPQRTQIIAGIQNKGLMSRPYNILKNLFNSLNH